MALSILLYLALIIWLTFLGGFLSGFGWKDKIYSIIFSIFIWPSYLVQLVIFNFIWQGMAALAGWLLLVTYFVETYGISPVSCIIITVFWFIALWVIWRLICRWSKMIIIFDGIK